MWRSSLVRLASPYARAAATPALAAIRRPRAGVAARPLSSFWWGGKDGDDDDGKDGKDGGAAKERPPDAPAEDGAARGKPAGGPLNVAGGGKNILKDRVIDVEPSSRSNGGVGGGDESGDDGDDDVH